MSTSAKNAEVLKHRLAIELEAHKWGYRKLELQYLEAGQHLRSLNQIMWQVPGMAIAITGGLWYGATTIDSDAPRVWVLGFATIVNLLIVIILWRLRALIEVHICHQSNFAGIDPHKGGWKRTVITCWTIALLAAATVSGVGAWNPTAVAKRPTLEKPASCCDITIDLPPQQCTSPSPRPAPRKAAPQQKTPCSQ